MSNNVPFFIESTVFPEVFISANKGFTPPQDGTPLSISVDSRISAQPVPETEDRFAVELQVKLDSAVTSETPYFLNVVCLVLLSVDTKVPQEQRHTLALQAGHLVAFPAVREMVATITARQPWGVFSIGLGFLAPDEFLVQPAQPEMPSKPVRRRSKKTA